MKHAIVLKSVNVVLAVVVVAVLFGCGGDPVDPPKGSVEEKFCGDWEADPLPSPEGDKGIRHVNRAIDISYFGSGNGPHTSADYSEQPVLKDVTAPAPKEISEDIGDLIYDGLTATSDTPRADGSVWVLRLDAADPNVMYVTWTLKDGTRRLNEVKFRKKR
jgi:hypothetical protein